MMDFDFLDDEDTCLSSLSDLALALLYRGMNTERNVVTQFMGEFKQNDPTDKTFDKQLEAIEEFFRMLTRENVRRAFVRKNETL
jgi:site-specific recombinase XerD